RRRRGGGVTVGPSRQPVSVPAEARGEGSVRHSCGPQPLAQLGKNDLVYAMKERGLAGVGRMWASCWAAAIRARSDRYGPMIWSASGRPVFVLPAGSTIEGRPTGPARLIQVVWS